MQARIGLGAAWRAAAIACVLLATGCSGGAAPEPRDPAEEGRMRIVATVGMVADMVRGVAGDRAEVTPLMGTGVDPHLYRPTRSDMERMLGADAVFVSGLRLEGKMTETFERVRASGKPVFAVTGRIAHDRLLSFGTAAEDADPASVHADPHVWMDPSLWKEGVAVVRDRLTELDPGGADAYASNAAAYEGELDRLDAYAARVLATVPERARVLVTAHDAFGYFGRRYGYEVVGIQGISTESEAGVRDIERIVGLIVERGVHAVFVESTVSPRNIGALVDGAKARGGDVAIGGSLFSDAMGEPDTYEGSYIGMIDHNVTTIVRALGGDAPERGMDGRLTP